MKFEDVTDRLVHQHVRHDRVTNLIQAFKQDVKIPVIKFDEIENKIDQSEHSYQ